MSDIIKDFQVVIKEFYPIERNDKKLSGGLHVVIVCGSIELISLRGIYCTKNANRWFISLPQKFGTCHLTGERVPYKIFAFCNNAMNQKLLNEIRAKGEIFIEEWLEKKQTSLQKPNEAIDEGGPTPPRNIAPEAKETASTARDKPRPSIAAKQWQDPPKKKIKKQLIKTFF